MMALCATSSAASKPSPPLTPPPKTVALLHSKVVQTSRPVLTVTPTVLFALFTAPIEARAQILPKEQIVSSLTQVDSTIEQIQELGSNVTNSAGQAIGAISDVVKPGLDAALPFVKQALDEAVKVASPVVSEASKKAQEAMQSSGINTEPVMSAAKTVADAAQQTTKVIDGAKPIATSTVEAISSAEPIVILGAGGALLLAYLLLPPVFSAVSFNLRGYQGELTPAQTLDLLSTKNYILVDVRSEKDKDKAGVPRLPSSAKNNILAIPLEELGSKIKNLVRNAKKVEAELAALKISYLKRVNKGSNIVIMDSYSDSAKVIARTLTKLGFKNCWIVTDGFSGSKGWLQSRLGTDAYNFLFAEVLSPPRIIPAASRRFGTSSSTKLLPGSD